MKSRHGDSGPSDERRRPAAGQRRAARDGRCEGSRSPGAEGEVREREKEDARRGRVEKLCKCDAHGPHALRPFPDADAPVSRSGRPVRETTTAEEARCTRASA